MNYKRIHILFENKNYEVEVNPLHSIHHIIYDLYHNIIKKKYNFYKIFYDSYLIEKKDYFLKVCKKEVYLSPDHNIDLYDDYELMIQFDMIILLNILTEYISFVIKIIILTHIIIQYILLNLLKKYYCIEVENKIFTIFYDFTCKSLFIAIFLFTIVWMILLYIFFIKNRKKNDE